MGMTIMNMNIHTKMAQPIHIRIAMQTVRDMNTATELWIVRTAAEATVKMNL
jgi:hypothetical protein